MMVGARGGQGSEERMSRRDERAVWEKKGCIKRKFGNFFI